MAVYREVCLSEGRGSFVFVWTRPGPPLSFAPHENVDPCDDGFPSKTQHHLQEVRSRSGGRSEMCLQHVEGRGEQRGGWRGMYPHEGASIAFDTL